jgi:hypothetical protein
MSIPPPRAVTKAISTPTWMGDMKALDDRPLKDIVIPGSHDAGTYVMENKIDNNSSQCQEISILEQLKAGARYLDLRAWKAKDGKYWMYHGKVWTHVLLEDVLTDIKTFLNQHTGEIVLATLLIDEDSGIDAGWQWACDQVRDHMATLADLPGKSFAQATPRELRDAGKRLVLLRHSDASQLICMDREGVYGDSLDPENYLKALENYQIWSDKMWILHLGIPYKGDIHNTMPTRSKWNADVFVPRFRGEPGHESWLTRRLNIINVDFIQRFGWVDAIVSLNEHDPKVTPAAMVPVIVAQNFTWSLKACNRDGVLHIETSTLAPFRAQQGQIHVYSAQNGFPADPDQGKTEAWAWDNDAQQWNTGLKWTRGMCIAWVAEKAANGPRVPFLKVETDTPVSSARATYTWYLRIGNGDGKLFLEGDTTAPFRAQQGQLHVYPLHSTFPADPDGKAEKWHWDNESHPWNVGLDWRDGQPIAWVAQKSPNGPYTLFLKHNL